MKGKVFVDSNILIYLFSSTELGKQKDSSELISEYNSRKQLVWSTQVAQEFCFNLIKKRKQDPLLVKSALSFFSNFELVVNDFMNIEKALDIQKQYQISFWDSLIMSSAVSSKCSYLITEDLQHGQKIEGIEVVNPFLEA